MKYEWLDDFLRSFPGAEYDYKLEWQWHRYRVHGKMFAAVLSVGEAHGGVFAQYAGHELINLKCDPRMGELLRAEHPDIRPGFYMDKHSWIAVYLDGALPDELLRGLCEQSYRLVVEKLPKYVQRALRDGEEDTGHGV